MNSNTITHYQMQAAIGSLLGIWSDIEWSLEDSIRKLNRGELPKQAHGPHRSMAVWQELMEEHAGDRESHLRDTERLLRHLKAALEVRNLVCHRYRGASAAREDKGIPAHLTVVQGDEERQITWDELQSMFRWLSEASSKIQLLTQAIRAKNDESSRAMAPCWKSWPDYDTVETKCMQQSNQVRQ